MGALGGNARMTKVAAVICTHNRLRYLGASIDSLLEQTLPRSDYEIIVVDNASSDGTREWVAERQKTAPDIRYVYEPALGLSNARNAGWRAARSEIVAYLDDDAVACPRWLEVIVAKFSERDDRLAVVGGRVDPLWEAPPPEWLAPEFWHWLSVLDLSPTDVVLTASQHFVGANMAMRKSALAAVGGFSSFLGRKGKSLLSNEEVLLKQRLEAAGYYAMYAPEAVAQHLVPAARMSREWFRRRHYWQGVSDALLRQAGRRPEGLRARARGLLNNLRATLRLARRWRRHDRATPHDARALAADFSQYERLGNLVGDWRALFTLSGR